MREKILRHSTTMIIVLTVSLFVGTVAWAGSKDLTAGKRPKFQDDSVESMRDVFKRREGEDKEYREKMLSNSEKSIELLREIRDLLQQLNRKE